MANANELKDLGNKAFVAKDYETAIKHFSAAIALDPNNHILYSNRSACYASTKELAKALADGEKTIQLKPDFWKGYTRKAIPLYMMERYEEALQTYNEGLKYDANNATLLQGISDCEKAIQAPSPLGGKNPFAAMETMFTPDTIDRIRADPALSPYLSQPDFVEKVNSIIKNPKDMEKHIGDQRVMQVLLTFMKGKFKEMGLDLPTDPNAQAPPFRPPQSSQPKPAEPQQSKQEPPKKEEPKKTEPKKEEPKKVEPEPMEVDGDNAKAEEEKEKGNEAYKAKDFAKALEHYGKAIELNGNNISYYLNRAAVYIAMGEYDRCVEECDAAVEKGRSVKCDFKQIGRAYHRKGKALMKQGKYREAEQAFQKSLTENRTAEVLKDLQTAEKLRKKKEEEEYYDVDKSIAAKTRGNEFFQKQQYPEAVKEYTEAIRRNPKDAPLYSNRAAAYTKLMAYSDALKDCDKCIELDPKFIKGYTRKATVHFFMKDYHKALKMYEQAMEIDNNNQDVVRGYSQTLQKIQETRGDKDRAERSLQDPEIQGILREDQVQSILQLLKSDPAAAQRAISQNRELSRKFSVLMSAGLV